MERCGASIWPVQEPEQSAQDTRTHRNLIMRPKEEEIIITKTHFPFIEINWRSRYHAIAPPDRLLPRHHRLWEAPECRVQPPSVILREWLKQEL